MSDKPSKTLIIAEAGVNHNGSFEKACELVEAAAEAGADIVKFQTFDANMLVTAGAQKADYQKSNTGEGSQLEMLQKLMLSQDEFFKLMDHANQKKIEFLSTAFDIESQRFLQNKINLTKFKIPSGEITNGPLILETARSQKPIILSTGMATIDEIQDALSVIAFGYTNRDQIPGKNSFREAFDSDEGQKKLQQNVTVLHCTTEYPAPFDEINLRAMFELGRRFNLPIGYSDHTVGIEIPIAAVALGATVIEKHFTLDKSMEGPDHKASLDPAELKSMVTAIRHIERALGYDQKAPSRSELANAKIARKSLVALDRIETGDAFSEKNITAKRPGTGISPMKYWQYLGETAKQSYEKDDLLQE